MQREEQFCKSFAFQCFVVTAVSDNRCRRLLLATYENAYSNDRQYGGVLFRSSERVAMDTSEVSSLQRSILLACFRYQPEK